MTAEPPILEIRDVTRAYPATIALDRVSLALRSGRITCLLGPSGCGKSTLLRLVAGLEPVDGGEIEAAGEILSRPGATVAPEARNIGLVFQDFALFPHLDVAGNVAFGLAGLDGKARRARVAELLDRFRLGHRIDAWPHTLSGGEQQRVAIARAMARDPAALLLDEPFSGLDGDLRAEARQVVLDGLRAAHAAVLIVTHDPEEAMLMADDLALMSAGRLLQAASPEICYLNPASLAAARLLGAINAVPAEVKSGVAHSPFGSLATDLPDGPATLMLRPEALAFGPDGAAVTVTGVRFGGAFHQVRVEAQGIPAIVRAFGSEIPRAGPACVRLDPERARLFAA